MVHGCMVYTERAETAAVSRGTSRFSAVRTPLQRSESARERRIALHKSDQQLYLMECSTLQDLVLILQSIVNV